jgi:hypothetical protein
MASMDKPSCASCQFFTKPGDPEFAKQTAYGLCVRYPTPIEHNERHWCGEYRAKIEQVQIREPKQVRR